MRKAALLTITCMSPLFLLAQNIGIGTNTPAARLHVADSSVLFSGPLILPANPGNPPATGAGVRMMWYSRKAAFRAGLVEGNEWDRDNIGPYSFGMGVNTRASGLFSAAMGTHTRASGDASVALGSYTTAKAYAGISMGYLNDDSDNPSLLLALTDRIFQLGNGIDLNNKRNAITVLRNGNVGIGTVNPGALLHVNGKVLFADGTQAANRVLTSDANGLASWQDLPASISYWQSAGFGLGIKYHDIVAVNSPEGRQQISLYVKGNVLAEAPFSTGIDDFNYGLPAIGQGSYSLWYADKGAFIAGGNSAALDPTAIGRHSVALGRDNLAVGTSSVAAGYSSQARGWGSAALGNGLITRAQGSVAVGTYNLPDNFDDRNFPSDKLFQVGNGTNNENRRNAMTILRSGNVGIGTVSPQTVLHVKSESGEALRIQSSDPFIGFYDNAGTYSGFIWSNKLFGNDFRLGTPGTSNMPITLAPNGYVSLIAAINGKIGIGTITPLEALDVVAGPSATATKVVIGNRGGFGPAALEFVSDYGLSSQWRPGYITSNDNGGFTGRLEFFTNGTGSGNLYGAVKGLEVRNGATLTATGSVGSFSDARLKNQIEPFTDGLNVIEHINPVQFQYNADAPFVTPDRQVGIVAQELEKVAPYMVHQTAEGNVKDMRWVDNQAYVFLLINAVKELTSRDEAYKAQLEVLEKRVKELDQRNLQQQQEIEKLKAKDHPKFSIK